MSAQYFLCSEMENVAKTFEAVVVPHTGLEPDLTGVKLAQKRTGRDGVELGDEWDGQSARVARIERAGTVYGKDARRLAGFNGEELDSKTQRSVADLRSRLSAVALGDLYEMSDCG